MCGGYSITTKADILKARFDAQITDDLYLPNFNARPGQYLPVILNTSPKVIHSVYWGYRPHWLKKQFKKNIINTRAESIFEKPFFKDSILHRRCLVIADGFYEWGQKKLPKKQPYRITMNNELLAFAGIWDTAPNTENPGFSIITTVSAHPISKIHSRMPIILKKTDEKKWIDSNTGKNEITKILQTQVEDLNYYPVSGEINKPANNHPDLIKDISGGRGGT